MRSLFVLLLVGCSGPGPTPSDAGTAETDAGPRCLGVPSLLTQFTCVGQGEPGSARCTEPTLKAAVTAHFSNCDAGPGILGHLSVGDCGGGLRAVRWVYGFPGDTYECVYASDGGASVGGINFGDRGVFVSGQVGDCSTEPPAMCP